MSLARLERQLGNAPKRKYGQLGGKQRVAKLLHECKSRRVYLLESLSAFPVQIVDLVHDYDQEECVYWPSVGHSGPIRVWRWAVEQEFAPSCVAISDQKNFDNGPDEQCLAKLVNGSFFLLFQIRPRLYHFDSTTSRLSELDKSTPPWIDRYGTPAMISTCDRRRLNSTWILRRGKLTAVSQTSFTDQDHEFGIRSTNETWLYFSGGYQTYQIPTAYQQSNRTLDGEPRHSEVFVLKLDRHNKIIKPWQKCPSLVIPVGEHAACGANGALVVSGGMTGEQFGEQFAIGHLWNQQAAVTDACSFYHPEFDRWVKLPNLPTPLKHHSMIYMDQKLLVFVRPKPNVTGAFAQLWSLGFTPRDMQTYQTNTCTGHENKWQPHSTHSGKMEYGSTVHPLSSSSLITWLTPRWWDFQNYTKLDSRPQKPLDITRLDNQTWSTL